MSEHRTNPNPERGGTTEQEPLMSGSHSGHLLHPALRRGTPLVAAFGLPDKCLIRVGTYGFTCARIRHFFRADGVSTTCTRFTSLLQAGFVVFSIPFLLSKMIVAISRRNSIRLGDHLLLVDC